MILKDPGQRAFPFEKVEKPVGVAVQIAQSIPIENIRNVERQREWGWKIAAYLYLAGIGAGSFITGVLTDWLDHSTYPSRLLLWGPILVALGVPFLILDLGIKRRFLTAWQNPRTSWEARGFLILSAFIVVGFATLAMSINPFPWLNDKSSVFTVMEGIGLVLAIATATYTGILLQSTKYISLWNTSFLPPLFLISATSTGLMGIILSTTGYELFFSSPAPFTDTLILVEQILILAEAVVLGSYLYFVYCTKEQGRSSVNLLLSGKLKLIFWFGIVTIGFVLPIILLILYTIFHGSVLLVFITGLFLLTGAYFLRFGIVSAGIKERSPFQKLINMQYEFNR